MTPTQKQEVLLEPPAKASQAEAAATVPIVCPHCGSDNVRQSSTRRGMDLMPSNIGKEPHRCRECRVRFYLKRENDSATPGTPQRRRSHRKRDPIWKHPILRRNANEITIAVASLMAFAVFLYLLARSGIAF